MLRYAAERRRRLKVCAAVAERQGRCAANQKLSNAAAEPRFIGVWIWVKG
jgi:hypothetical protein